MKESIIESKVCKYAQSKGWLVFKFVSPGNRAVPDRVFIKNCVLFFIEFKAPGKKQTILQEKISKKLNNEGFEVFVVDDIEKGKQIIDEQDEDPYEDY